jgi:FAD/FMN-containing dehydrogenase
MWELPTRARKSAEPSSAHSGDPQPHIFQRSARLSNDGEIDQGGGWRMDYAEATDRLLASYRSIPRSATVRLAKKTSNLFRTRQAIDTPGLDVTGLDRVFAVDTEAMTADVGGMCTFEHLVAATLPHGLAPLVVPQLKTITVGGAITGGGIESTSFRNGLSFECMAEIDVLTGAGEIITASPTENADLFYGFPNSYGTLGYATRVTVKLERIKPFVTLRHLRFGSVTELQDALATIVDERRHLGVAVDYLDGVVFSRSESYLTLGTLTDDPGATSDYTGQQIYYKSIKTRSTDRLTIHDYLWRWDTDWFWCSRAFGAQQPLVRRLWPGRWLRSSVYWKLVALDRRFDIANRLERLHHRPPFERVVQDIEVPIGNTAAFVDWFLDTIPIEPVWLCPLKLPADPGSRLAGGLAESSLAESSLAESDRRDEPTWPLYPIPPGRTYVNVGFWSVVPQDLHQNEPGHPEGATNRIIEERVTELGGHKSLYSDAYYSPEEFAELYGGETYAKLKAYYDPESRLLNLYDKAVRRQ